MFVEYCDVLKETVWDQIDESHFRKIMFCWVSGEVKPTRFLPLRDNEADVLSDSPASDPTEGLWDVCVYVGGRGAIFLVEKWWYKHMNYFFLAACLK